MTLLYQQLNGNTLLTLWSQNQRILLKGFLLYWECHGQPLLMPLQDVGMGKLPFQWVVYTGLILYPPAQPITENSWWLNCSFGDEYFDDLSLPSDFSLALQEQTTENLLINQFVSSTTCTDFPQSFAQLDQIFGDEFQENMALSNVYRNTMCLHN